MRFLSKVVPLGFKVGFPKSYRLDRNHHGGNILIYVSEDIASKELKLH